MFVFFILLQAVDYKSQNTVQHYLSSFYCFAQKFWHFMVEILHKPQSVGGEQNFGAETLFWSEIENHGHIIMKIIKNFEIYIPEMSFSAPSFPYSMINSLPYILIGFHVMP